MLRETKFNYGLLFLGAAMPPIIDAIFGRSWALLALVLIGCAGLLFLWSGHFHRQDGETETRRKRYARFALLGCVIALAIIGVRWAISESGTHTEQAEHKETSASVAVLARPAQLKSRIRIWNVDLIPIGAVSFPKDETPFPAINVYYDVVGQSSINSVAEHFAAAFSNGRLSEDQIKKYQDGLLSKDWWTKLMADAAQKVVYPGDPPQFTTIPPSEGTVADLFRKNWGEVGSGKKTLYILLAFKYRDNAMPRGSNGVTEACFYYSVFSFGRHECGRNRSFIERIK